MEPHPAAGHCANQDNPAVFDVLLAGFLDEVVSRRGPFAAVTRNDGPGPALTARS